MKINYTESTFEWLVSQKEDIIDVRLSDLDFHECLAEASDGYDHDMYDDFEHHTACNGKPEYFTTENIKFILDENEPDRHDT